MAEAADLRIAASGSTGSACSRASPAAARPATSRCEIVPLA